MRRGRRKQCVEGKEGKAGVMCRDRERVREGEMGKRERLREIYREREREPEREGEMGHRNGNAEAPELLDVIGSS